jgi:hypothetical protein
MKHRMNLDYSIFGILLVISLIILAMGGWIANVVKFVGMLGGDVTAMFVARIVWHSIS